MAFVHYYFIWFVEEKLEIVNGCDTGALKDEKVRNGEHKLQPEATTPALYSTQNLTKFDPRIPE